MMRSRILRIFTFCAAAALLCALLVRGSYQNGQPTDATAHPGAQHALLASTVAIPQTTVVPLAAPATPSQPATASPRVHAELGKLFDLADQLRESVQDDLEEGDNTPKAPAPESENSDTTKAPKAKPAPAKEAAPKYREAWAVVTAYCPCTRCCGRDAAGTTSIGKSAWRPGIAADPRAIPYGTRVFVPGYGSFMVDDTGSAMRRSWRNDGKIHLDIRMTYHWQAKEWGNRLMKIRIYE